jgi:NAD-reducing hydrogenase large subunit
MMPEALEISRRCLHWYKLAAAKFTGEAQTFANFPSLFMGLVTDSGGLEHYDGWLRVVDAKGEIVLDKFQPRDYQEIIEEAVEPYSFMKFPYYKKLGYPQGIYRVGPLARLNIIDHCGTPIADQEWAEFRQIQRGAVLSSFHYHHARLIEIIFGIEMMERILKDPNILHTNVRARARPNQSEGIGVSEAPRGTLIHHYRIDDNGLMVWANLIIATGHNNLAMNRGILQAAQHYVDGNKINEGALNRVEAVIRCYDPCLSCATHAIGKMPLQIRLVRPGGVVVHEIFRD